MTIDFNSLKKVPRLRIEAKLEVDMGKRFQPTGFPNLGAAVFDLPNGGAGLIVESAQSMSNRMEKCCWNERDDDWTVPLRGLPVIKVVNKEHKPLTNSVLEAHRINSPYIIGGKDDSFLKILKTELVTNGIGSVNLRRFYELLLRYDPNTLVHGVFLSGSKRSGTDIMGGRYKLPRALIAFIDAGNVNVASSGGVKMDQVDPSGKTALGFGHVPYNRDEYTSPDIIASFKLDLAQIRGYGLGGNAVNFIIAFSLYKIQKVLTEGLRLRTACEFECAGLNVKTPIGWNIPTLAEIEKELPALIKAVADEKKFRDIDVKTGDRSTIITYEKKKEKKDEVEDISSEEMDN